MLVIILAALLAAQLTAIVVAMYAGRAKLKRLVAEARNSASPARAAAFASGGLSESDRSILAFLLMKGGAAYQSEIARELRLPKSTVHKALRRLSEAGYVEIKREGRFNVVMLKRDLTSEALAA